MIIRGVIFLLRVRPFLRPARAFYSTSVGDFFCKARALATLCRLPHARNAKTNGLKDSVFSVQRSPSGGPSFSVACAEVS